MKKNKKTKYLILILILILIIIIYVINNKSNSENKVEKTTTTETEVIKTDILNTVSKSSYIQTALEEKKQLHTTYYFEEIYYEINQYIKQGENILKYTNGKYMVAPYNCVITELSIPDNNQICTNQHYIIIQSTDNFKISLEIEEDELNTINIGQEAKIEIETLPEIELTGYVTNISNTATYSSSGSTFGIEVEFQNNGEILLGMSAKCSVILEKAESVIAVASEAIIKQNNKKYVIIKQTDGTEKQVEIETGIKNDAYTEVKSGLNEGDTVLIEENTQQNNMKSNMKNNMQNNRQKGTNARKKEG